LIILQLKSTQGESALSDINKAISQLKNEWGYKIRGHEIHQIRRNMERRTLRERALLVSSFCCRNEIEYLTYHVPVSRNEGRGLFDERSYEQADDSILATLNEVEMVHEQTGLGDKVVIVHHLPSVIGSNEFPHPNSDQKFQILECAERHFLDFYRRSSNYFQLRYFYTGECFSKVL
jgi:hypothetical protein